MPTFQNEKVLSDVTPSVDSVSPQCTGGVTLRVVLFSIFLATLFGYCIPIVDFQMSNTFLGAMHMPAAAVATLIALLLVINPLLGLLSHPAKFSRNEMLVVYITCLFSSLVTGRGKQ